MKRCLILLVLLAATVSGRAVEKPRLLEKANVLPLALDDAFQFRKTELFFNDPEVKKFTTDDEMLQFEQQRINYGAINNVQRRARMGNYFTFFWRTNRHANLTFRLEYRQEKTGSFVQAQEVSYPDAHGSINTKFHVLGDDYFENGRVIAWRAVLIENGKIVGLTQSYLWN
jgi:hypothetical protein